MYDSYWRYYLDREPNCKKFIIIREVMTEIFILLASIVVILLILYYKKDGNEGFNMNYYLDSCPSGFKLTYNSAGDIVCCGGEMIGDMCLSDKKCILSSKGTSDIPTCVDYLMKEYKEKGEQICPKSMPNYFNIPLFNIDACTDGPINKNLSGPLLKTQQVCAVFGTSHENEKSLDSCFNHKKLEQAQCFGDACTKSLKKFPHTKSILVELQFNDSSGIRRTAFTRNTFESYLDEVQPGWRDKGVIDTSKNIAVADVAKAYFIDRTISSSDIQI